MIALEGEFAMTEGHAQELKTQALALQVGKRLRVILSDNNAGIDDVLLGGVVPAKYADSYKLLQTKGLEPRENSGSWISRAGKKLIGV